jgi:hypothetical protein
MLSPKRVVPVENQPLAVLPNKAHNKPKSRQEGLHYLNGYVFDSLL